MSGEFVNGEIAQISPESMLNTNLQKNCRSALSEQAGDILAQAFPANAFGYHDTVKAKIPATLEEYVFCNSRDKGTRINQTVTAAMIDLLGRPDNTNVSFRGGGLLDRVTFDGGHNLSMTYLGGGLIGSVSMDGRTVNFVYDNGRLQSIDFDGRNPIHFPMDPLDPGQVEQGGKGLLRSDKKIAFKVYEYLADIKPNPDTIVFPGTDK